MRKEMLIIANLVVMCLVPTFNHSFFQEKLVESKEQAMIIKRVIESKEEAIIVAKEHVMRKYSSEFPEYEIKASLASDMFLHYKIETVPDEDIWVVWYSLIPTSPEVRVYGGGGPVVYIQKSTGEVLDCSLYK